MLLYQYGLLCHQAAIVMKAATLYFYSNVHCYTDIWLDHCKSYMTRLLYQSMLLYDEFAIRNTQLCRQVLFNLNSYATRLLQQCKLLCDEVVIVMHVSIRLGCYTNTRCYVTSLLQQCKVCSYKVVIVMQAYMNRLSCQYNLSCEQVPILIAAQKFREVTVVNTSLFVDFFCTADAVEKRIIVDIGFSPGC